MTQPTQQQIGKNLQELAANIHEMSMRADQEASRCNATLAAIHPENVTPLAFAELKQVTRDLSEIYVSTLHRLAGSLDELANSITNADA